MDKNSIIGFVLIGVILFGFTWYQAGVSRKQMEYQAQYQAQLDSIARADSLAWAAEHPQEAVEAAVEAAAQPAAQAQQPSIYKDSLLETSSHLSEEIVTLENEKLEIKFTTKGAKPYSVRLKDYRTSDSTDLYLFREGSMEYAASIYTGEYIKTSDFVFTIAEKTDSSIVMRLPFSGGGYIEQSYSLEGKDSYAVSNLLSFIGMEGIVPKNVSAVDIDFSMVIPRMEKGYRNESQYSKLDYYFDGDKKPVEIGRGRNASKRIDSKLSWFAFQQQFFSAIVRAPGEFASGALNIEFMPQEDPERNLMACSANMRVDYPRDSEVSVPLEFYFGPNHFNTLKQYGQKYEKIIPLGGWLVGWFTRFVIIPLFNFLHKYIANFGIIILLMTLIIKIVVMPLTNKSLLSSAKMAALKPLMDKLNEKYPKQEDALKKQQATMDLYKRAGVSPMGGCLPTLLTFPILWAMFRFFPASIELRQQSFLWCHDLSAYDSIIDYGTRIPILGDHLSLFALLMAVTMWFYSKMTMASNPAANDPNAASMRFMSVWMMPIMMFFICNSLSAALSYYYLLSNLFMMLQNFILRRFFVHPEELLAKVKASEGKALPKSKWQQRLEAAQKMQQQQMREQQKKRK